MCTVHSIPFSPPHPTTQRLSHCSGKGSFFKPHVDTPRSEMMFGSLVIVFPTPHEGGALFLRHGGHEWIFDSGRELAASREPSIGYVTFFSDVEHEVAPVISGHRVTLTYNLYFDDGEGTTSSNSVSEHLPLPPAANEYAFRETFKALIENPEFMPDGGTLGFGMRHVYPIASKADHPNPLEPIYSTLKGSDAIVYQTTRALGFQPVLYMFYKVETRSNLAGAVIDKVFDLSDGGFYYQTRGIAELVVLEGGIEVCQAGTSTDEHYDERVERVEWVSPVTKFNRHRSAFGTYGNEPSMDVVYADLCMFVRIGKVGERMAYPSVSQLKKEWERGRGV
jgi:hypothetical protein